MAAKSFCSFLSFLAFLIFFIILTLFFTVRYLDPNDYKADIAFFLLDATGRPVTMEGDMRLEFFPWFGVSTGPVRIGNAPGFGPDEFLEVDGVSLRIKVLPFFKKKLVVDRVVLSRPVLHLRRNRDGVANWDDLVERVPDLAVPPVPLSVEAQPYFKGVEVLGVTMENGLVLYEDDLAGTNCTASNVELRTGPLIPDKPLGVDIGMSVSGLRPGMSGQVHMAGTVGGLWAGDPWLEHTNFLVRSTLPGTKGAEAELSGILDYEAEDGGFLLTGCELRTLGQVFKGEFAGKGLLSHTVVNGTLTGGPLSPRKFWQEFYPKSPFPVASGRFEAVSLKTWLAFDNASLTLRNMRLGVDKGAITGTMRLADWEKPKVTFDLAVKGLNTADYFAAFASDTDKKNDAPICVPEGTGIWPVEIAGRLKLGSQEIEGVEAENLVADIKAGAGRLTVDAGADTIFGGRLKGRLTSEAPSKGKGTGTTGRTSLSLTAQGVESRSVLEHFGLGTVLSGKADAEVTLSSAGCGVDSLLRNGVGRVRIRMPEGGRYLVQKSDRNMTLPFASADAGLTLNSAGPDSGRVSGTSSRKPGMTLNLKVTGVREKTNRPFKLAVAASGDVTFSRVDHALAVRDAAVHAELENGFLPKSKRTGVLDVRGSYDGFRDTVYLDRAELTALGLKVRTTGEVRGLQAGKPSIEGKLRVPDIKVRSLMKIFGVTPPVTRDDSVLQAASFSTDYSLDTRRARLSDLRLSMDGMDILGSVTVNGLDDPELPPLFRFDLEAGDVDADRYRPPYKESPYDCTNPDPSPGTPLPLELLSSLRLDGDLSFQRFKVIGLEFLGLGAEIKAEQGSMDLKTTARDYFGGTFEGNLTAEVSPRLLDTSFQLAAEGFDAGRFLIGLDDAPYVKGNADLYFNLDTHGDDIKELTGNLHGTSSFEVRDGSWNFMISQDGKLNLTKEEENLPRNRRTYFDVGSASLIVDKGVFTNSDLAISGTLLSGSGYGGFSLPDDTIDLTFIITVGRTATVPVKVTGCLSDPEDHVPKGELVGGIAKDIVTLPLRPFQYLQELLFE